SVRELAELGIRMMLDDFGYGYATLSSLVDMPISGLKIDRRMVSKLPTSSVARKAVKHILKMANDMGLKVVAEGSQSLQEDIYLSELGCNYGQGFGFSRPVSAEILTELVNCPPMRH
ncbi:MAG: EAL domain-containing protein, partial [Pseudomonadota bacterium]